MKDLNFFSSYSKKSNKKSFDKSIVLYGILILVIMGILIYGLSNFIAIKKLSNDVATINLELEANLKNTKIKEILDKEQQIKVIKEDMAKLKALDKYVQDRDVVNELLLEDIRNNIPSLLFISSMSVNPDGIRIEGKSKDKESIAQFEHNLRSMESFERVFISQVTDDNGHYSFYLDIRLKEENADGA